MLDVHATGPFRLLRAAGRHFRAMAKEGRTASARKVVNVSSVSGLFGEATQFSYAAAKSALVGMTRSLAKDWGRYNVTVNCVAFGLIETRLTQTFAGEVPEIEIGERKLKVGLDAAQVEAMKRLIPLGRAGTPEERRRGFALLSPGIGFHQRRNRHRRRRAPHVNPLGTPLQSTWSAVHICQVLDIDDKYLILSPGWEMQVRIATSLRRRPNATRRRARKLSK